MRIIGGEFKGRRLFAPRGKGIRPTADRVREAIFNILGDHCRGETVFDIFAGTGAMGLEALSRGAAYAVFIDSHRLAVDAIRRNIEACGCESRARVLGCDARRSPRMLASVNRPAGIVFMDPPYRSDPITPTVDYLHLAGLLAPGARMIIEHAHGQPLAVTEDYFRPTDHRRYGKTLVSFFEYVL